MKEGRDEGRLGGEEGDGRRKEGHGEGKTLLAHQHSKERGTRMEEGLTEGGKTQDGRDGGV